MKIWKKILLEAGIFTAVFALGAGTGFLSCYHKAEEKQPTIKNDALEVDPTPREETPTDKYLNNLVATKALAGDISLTISTKGNSEDTPIEDQLVPIRRGIEDLNFDIKLEIKNIQLSIADLENIKLSADLNVQMSNLNIKATLGYFDNTIYLDYADTYFKLKTDDITDFMRMLPTFGVDLGTSSGSLLDSLDIDGLTSSLATMQEFIEEGEHYFLFNFNENIAIKLLSDDEYHMIGVELPECSIKGLTVSATSTLHSLDKDIEGMINPSLKEGAPEYTDFKHSFALINRVIDLVNSKQANVTLDVDVDKIGGDEDNVQLEDFIDLEGDIDFDINELKVLADLDVTYANKEYKLSAGYQDETIFATYKNLKVSITNQSVLTLVDFIAEKLNKPEITNLLDNLGDVSSKIDIDLDTILTYVNDIPEFIQNFKLTSNSLSLTFGASYFKLPVSDFDIAITWDDESLKSLSVTGLSYAGYQINVTLGVNTYDPVVIVPSEYVALDPAISLVSSVEKLINQDTYGVSFSLTTDDGDDSTVYDLHAQGEMYFTIRDKTENDAHILPTKRTFNYGSGELTIWDGDNYPHNIIMDAQPTENKTGKVLLSYGGTSNHRTNARIDYNTFNELFGKIKTLTETSDTNISQLIGSLMSSAEASPISQIINATETSDYLMLLDADIITDLSISATEIEVSINGDFLGFGTNDLNIRIRYEGKTIKGLDIINLQFGGTTINFSGELLEFDEEAYAGHHLTEDSSYIDLSTISQFAEQTLNTVENNYFHIKGTIALDFDSGILNKLAELFVKKTMTLDLQMVNTENRFSLIAHLTDIPTMIGVSDGVSLLTLNYKREAYLMYDNEKEVDGDGLFYVHRIDSYTDSTDWFKSKTVNAYSKYDLEGFKDNLMVIFMSDILGLGSSIMESVTNIKSEEGQIEYENIIETYEYNESYNLSNTYFNDGHAASVNKYTFAINIGELAQSDSLKTLTVVAYARNGMLAGIDADLSLHAGIDMSVHAKLYLQNDTSTSAEGVTLMHGSQTIASYMAAHAGDPLNQRA